MVQLPPHFSNELRWTELQIQPTGSHVASWISVCSTDVWLRLPPHQPCSTWFQARVKDLKEGKTWISEAFRQCRVHTHNLSAWCNLDEWKLMKFIFPTWISSGSPIPNQSSCKIHVSGTSCTCFKQKNEHLPNVLDSCTPKTRTNGGLKFSVYVPFGILFLGQQLCSL